MEPIPMGALYRVDYAPDHMVPPRKAATIAERSGVPGREIFSRPTRDQSPKHTATRLKTLVGGVLTGWHALLVQRRISQYWVPACYLDQLDGLASLVYAMGATCQVLHLAATEETQAAIRLQAQQKLDLHLEQFGEWLAGERKRVNGEQGTAWLTQLADAMGAYETALDLDTSGYRAQLKRLAIRLAGLTDAPVPQSGVAPASMARWRRALDACRHRAEPDGTIRLDRRDLIAAGLASSAWRFREQYQDGPDGRALSALGYRGKLVNGQDPQVVVEPVSPQLWGG